MTGGAPRKVLIVDDDPDLGASLSDILTGSDYEVLFAENRSAALAALEQFEPMVALIDVKLGDENGLELLSAMHEKRPALIGVMMSGYAEYEIAMSALRGGAYDYLVKPIHPDALLAVLSRCYDRLFRQAQMQLAYQQLIKARDQSEVAARAKSTFLAMMGRELRTPLNSIIGFSEMINAQMLGPVGNARYAEYAGHIAHTGRQLFELISRIIDQSALDSGTLELSQETVDLVALVEWCIGTVRARGEAADQSFDIRLPSQPVLLNGDEKRLKQAVVNVIANAVQFNRPAGRVAVTLTINHDRDVEIRVEDNGIGIAAEDLGKLFQPFTRLSADPQTKPGSGLGLSLAASFVRLHDGTIRLESQPGTGTTVRIVLPGKRLTVRWPAPRTSAAAPQKGSKPPSGPSSQQNSGSPSGGSSGENARRIPAGQATDAEPRVHAAPLNRR